MSGPQVLIIDDELQIRRFLRISLEANGYTVIETATGQEGINQVALRRPELVILDMGLPDMDGLDVLRRLREWTAVPVIVLSVRDSDRVKVTALDAGADDYLTKPFSLEELMARLRVIQRRQGVAQDSPMFTAGRLQVDLNRRQVTVAGEPVKLTPTEYALLRYLVHNAGKVVTHRQILREVWGPEYVDETHYLRVYFAQLRQKIEADPSIPRLIITEPGVGYRLAID
jgi:two-component system KDP operon response regulator KdpE